MQTHCGCNIMIVEDDYFVARELAEHFRSADATVLGPFPSVSDACHHVDKADLALTDHNRKRYPQNRRTMAGAAPTIDTVASNCIFQQAGAAHF